MWKLEVWGWWAWIDWVLAGAFSGYHFGCGARQRSRRWWCWRWWCCCGPSQRDKRSEQKKSLRKLKKNSFFRYNDDGGGAGPGIWMATKSRLCGYGKLELISRRRRHHRDTMRFVQLESNLMSTDLYFFKFFIKHENFSYWYFFSVIQFNKSVNIFTI